MIAVLGDQDVCKEPWARDATLNRTARRQRLHDPLATGAGELRAYVPDDFEASRNPFEHFRYVFPQFVEL